MNLKELTAGAPKNRSAADIILELCLFPAAIGAPFFVLKELMGGLAGAPSMPAVTFAVLASILIILAIIHLGNMYTDGPLPYFTPLYLTQTAFFVCFFIIFRSKESFRLPQQTLFAVTVSFAIVVFLARAALQGSLAWRRNYLNLPIFMILFWGLVSFCFSTSFFISLQDYFELLFIIVLFWLNVNTLDRKRHFTYIAGLAVTIGALMSLIGVMQHFNFTEIYGLERNLDMFSTLGNKNYVAELMAMLLPFTLALIAATDCPWKKLPLWLAVQFMLVIVLISQTRGSWIGLFAGLAVLVLYGIDRLDREHAKSLLITVGAFLVNSVALMFLSQKQHIFYKGPTAYSERFMSIIRELNSIFSKDQKMWGAFILGIIASIVVAQLLLKRREAKIAAAAFILFVAAGTTLLIGGVRKQLAENPALKAAAEIDLNKTAGANVYLDDSIASRRFIYGGSMMVVKNYPFGTGIGAFKTKYLSMLKKYLKEKGIKTIPGFFKDVNAKEAHNEYLHTLAEQGPVGLLILLFFIVRLVLYFYRVYYRKCDAYTSLLVLGAFSGLVAIGGSALLGFPFRIVPTAVVCGMLMAIMVFGEDRAADAARAEEGSKEPPITSDPRRWRLFRMQPAEGLTLVLLVGLPVFATASTLAVRWQLSNIVLKEGDALTKYKRYDDALARFDEARSEDPSNGEIYFSLGMLYQSLADAQPDKREQNLDKAIGYFLTSLHYYELPMARLNLGAAYFQKGEMYLQQANMGMGGNPKSIDMWLDYFAKARKEFDETISLYPNYSLPWFNLGLIDYENAMYEMGRGNNTKAASLLKNTEDLLKKTIGIDPGLVSANFKLSLVYEKQGRQDDALKQYEKTVVLPPTGPGDNETLADAFYNLGILYYNKAIATFNSSNAQGLSQEKRDTLKAEAAGFNLKSQKMFYRTIEMNPNHIKALNNLGNILYQEGRVDEAMANYKRALDIDPSYFEPKINMPLIYLSKNQFSDAMRFSKELLQTAGLSGDRELKVLRIYGVCNLRLGNLEEANKALSTVVNKFKGTPLASLPEYNLALSDLAEKKRRRNDPAAAAPLLKLAGSSGAMSPIDHLRSLNRLAVMQLNSNKTGESLETLKSAMGTYSQMYNSIDYANIIYNHAVVLTKLGRVDEARQSLDRFLRNNPITNAEVKAKINDIIGKLKPQVKIMPSNTQKSGEGATTNSGAAGGYSVQPPAQQPGAASR